MNYVENFAWEISKIWIIKTWKFFAGFLIFLKKKKDNLRVINTERVQEVLYLMIVNVWLFWSIWNKYLMKEKIKVRNVCAMCGERCVWTHFQF